VAFRNRIDAGRRLAERCGHLRGPDTVVLGLPRGGVPVADEVARALGAPLDVIIVRKLGVPGQPELAMGAIGEGGVTVLDEGMAARLGIRAEEIAAVTDRERAELDRRVVRWRTRRLAEELQGRTAVIVDDGLATGSTARAACRVVRAAGAARIVLAVPVAPSGARRAMADVADEVICLETPAHFAAVGLWYDDFSPTTDDEVEALLHAAHDAGRSGGDPPTDPVPHGTDITVAGPDGPIVATLTVPAAARAVVAVAHGSGSGRHSPRNLAVAAVLHRDRIATLLPELGDDPHGHFAVELLAARFGAVVRALDDAPTTRGLPVGAMGASTGAAVALWAASEPGSPIAAVVSRGGRPDLAGDRLARVEVPTLLVVGGLDTVVIGLNREAAARLGGPHQLAIVPGATHLFEEPGTLAAAAELTRAWMVDHLGADRPGDR